MLRWLLDRINIWVILVSILVAGILLFLLAGLLFLLPDQAPQAVDPGTRMTMIPAEIPTRTPTSPPEPPTATPPPSINGVFVGGYVQISGTEGQGLRLRAGPGTDQEPRFLGMDSEVFMVKDGPKESDGFVWWYLEAPYDPGRSGWAASAYLSVVENPSDNQ